MARHSGMSTSKLNHMLEGGNQCEITACGQHENSYVLEFFFVVGWCQLVSQQAVARGANVDGGLAFLQPPKVALASLEVWWSGGMVHQGQKLVLQSLLLHPINIIEPVDGDSWRSSYWANIRQVHISFRACLVNVQQCSRWIGTVAILEVYLVWLGPFTSYQWIGLGKS